MGVPQIIHLNRIFHYKQPILGYHPITFLPAARSADEVCSSAVSWIVRVPSSDLTSYLTGGSK